MYKYLPVRRRKQKITEQMKVMIEEALNNNDEITARGIKSLLTAQYRYPYLPLSVFVKIWSGFAPDPTTVSSCGQ